MGRYSDEHSDECDNYKEHRVCPECGWDDAYLTSTLWWKCPDCGHKWVAK